MDRQFIFFFCNHKLTTISKASSPSSEETYLFCHYAKLHEVQIVKFQIKDNSPLFLFHGPKPHKMSQEIHSTPSGLHDIQSIKISIADEHSQGKSNNRNETETGLTCCACEKYMPLFKSQWERS